MPDFVDFVSGLTNHSSPESLSVTSMIVQLIYYAESSDWKRKMCAMIPCLSGGMTSKFLVKASDCSVAECGPPVMSISNACYEKGQYENGSSQK